MTIKDWKIVLLMTIFVFTSCSENKKIKSIAEVFNPESDIYFYCDESSNDKDSIESCIIEFNSTKYYKKKMIVYNDSGKLVDYLIYKPEGPIHHTYDELIKDVKLVKQLESSFMYTDIDILFEPNNKEISINDKKFDINVMIDNTILVKDEKNNTLYLIEIYN